MGFKLGEFGKAGLVTRTREVKCPDLKAWFDEGEDPVFKVRGLTGEEFYGVREAASKRNDLQAIATRLLAGQAEAMADAIEEFFGSVPEEFARRVEVLIHGCVDPELDRPAALKLFKHFPSQTHLITEEILKLTGEGSCLGESNGSGGTPESAMT